MIYLVFYSFQMQKNRTASMDTESLDILLAESKKWIGAHRYV